MRNAFIVTYAFNSGAPRDAGHYGVNLGALFHDYEVRDHRWPAIGEVDGKGAGAIGVYRVLTIGRSVSEIGGGFTGDGSRIDLLEGTVAVKVGHRNPHLETRGPRNALDGKFGALKRESVVTVKKFVVATFDVT